MRHLFGILAIGAAALSVACTGETPKKVPVPPEDQRTRVGVQAKINFQPKLDVLFVVDNSGSMDVHQTNLSNNISLFVQEFSKISGLDYHIGVITTDNKYENPNLFGRLQGVPLFVTDQTPNPVQTIAKNILVGTYGSSQEMMFDPTVAALSKPLLTTWNKDFYRPDAILSVVYVTDADDQSEINDGQMTYDFLKALKNGDDSQLVLYGIFISQETTSCPVDTDRNEFATLLIDFFSLSKATTMSLCDPQFGKQLANLGAVLKTHINKWIPLEQVPVENTISVKYGSQWIANDVNVGWTYDPTRVAIRLGDGLQLAPEPPGTEFEVFFVPLK